MLGSIFYISLFFLKGKPVSNSPNKSELRPKLPEGLRILLVEDTPLNQLVAVELLKKHLKVAHIMLAENGKIALEKLKLSDFDIVLMDVRMPVMDGIETSKILRNKNSDHFNDVLIVGFTANAIPQQIQECLDAGMNDCVTKPMNTGEFFSKLEKILNP